MTAATEGQAALAASAGPQDGMAVAAPRPRTLRRLLKRPAAVVSLAFLGSVVVVAVVAPIVLPWVGGQRAGDLSSVLQGPSLAHPLGTDTLGRDVVLRLLVGTRVTVVGVAEALTVALGFGVPLGVAAGYFGGRLDRVVTWLGDMTFAIPAIVLVLAVLSVFPGSMLAGMCAFGALTSPGVMRVVRSATLPVREQLHVKAGQVAGLSPLYLMTRHVLPRIAGPVIVQASLVCARALLVQSGLAYLSLLVAAPAPSWGGMVADGTSVLLRQPWLIWPPGLLIAITVLAFGLLGDVLRDATVEGWSRPAGRRPARRRLAGAGSAEPAQPLPARASGDDRPLLSVERLTVALGAPERPIVVVDDVCFDIRPGETVGIVGESGCGKSITAASILGLLPPNGAVLRGSIGFDGVDLACASEQEFRRVRGRSIGLVAQDPLVSLNPVLRVGTQLQECLRQHRRLTRRECKAAVLELLAGVHISQPDRVARAYPHELSGGMAQRVAMARALAGRPRLLIADEPTTALDVTVQAAVLDELRELQQRTGMAILLITHDWGVIADMCDRVVVMYAGQVVERADPGAMFAAPLHPYTEALLRSNPHGSVGGGPLPVIEGSVPQPGRWPAGCHFHPRCTSASTACMEAPVDVVAVAEGRETRCILHSAGKAA